jgi:hypothetical protein
MTLLFAAASAEAREVRMAGAGGDGSGCSTDYAGSATSDVDPARVAKPSTSDKPAIPRGADADASRPPRWHSFLPGMFR